MYVCTYSKRALSHEQPSTDLSQTLHALALAAAALQSGSSNPIHLLLRLCSLSALSLSRSPSLLFILFLLAVHWPLARVVENNCTASCSCPRSVRCQCRKTAALPLNRHTRCILSHAHVTSHLARALALALWQLQLHAQQAHCVWVWAAFYSPHRCCCWCRLNFFFVSFALQLRVACTSVSALPVCTHVCVCLFSQVTCINFQFYFRLLSCLQLCIFKHADAPT